MQQNQEKKEIPRYEVRFTNKNHPFMWLVCETRAKILLSDPETSLTSPVASLVVEAIETIVWKPEMTLVDVRIVSNFFLKLLGLSGRSGRSYGNQGLRENGLTTCYL